MQRIDWMSAASLPARPTIGKGRADQAGRAGRAGGLRAGCGSKGRIAGMGMGGQGLRLLDGAQHEGGPQAQSKLARQGQWSREGVWLEEPGETADPTAGEDADRGARGNRGSVWRAEVNLQAGLVGGQPPGEKGKGSGQGGLPWGPCWLDVGTWIR